MTDLPPEESTQDETEGIANLRKSFESTKDENAKLRQELALTKLGVTPNEVQMTALNAVLDGDWSDPEAVGAKYGELFGGSPSTPEPTTAEPANEADVTGEAISEAPAPPSGAILDSVQGMTAGANVPPEGEIYEDPVVAGYAQYQSDLAGGRPKADASSQVINRLIDRGAKDLPGGVYDREKYHEALAEGRVGIPPKATEIGRG